MNILFYLHKYPSYGGIENVTTYLANYFASKGNNVVIYSYVGVDHNMLLQYLNSTISYVQAVNSVDYDSFTNYKQLSDLVQSRNIECIIFQDSYVPVEKQLWRLKKEFSNIKVISVEHNTPDAFLKALKYEKPSSKFEAFRKKKFYPLYYYKILYRIRRRHVTVYSESDKYVLLTSKFMPVFKKVSGLSNLDKLLAIRNPITIETPTEIDWGIKRNICLFPARLVSQKGVGFLMEIWSKVESFHTNWDLVIVGDGPERKYIEEMIKTCELKHVILEGFQSNMIAYYESASILLVTSIYEGWPLTLSEAMAYGCVPIVFDCYLAVSEIVDNGKTGVVIPPFDIELYVKKLLDLMECNDLRLSMGKQAKVSSLKYDIEAIGSKWISFLSKELAK